MASNGRADACHPDVWFNISPPGGVKPRYKANWVCAHGIEITLKSFKQSNFDSTHTELKFHCP